MLSPQACERSQASKSATSCKCCFVTSHEMGPSMCNQEHRFESTQTHANTGLTAGTDITNSLIKNKHDVGINKTEESRRAGVLCRMHLGTSAGAPSHHNSKFTLHDHLFLANTRNKAKQGARLDIASSSDDSNSPPLYRHDVDWTCAEQSSLPCFKHDNVCSDATL